jgi:hypothetical protein
LPPPLRIKALDAGAQTRGALAERDALRVKLQEQVSDSSSALVEQYEAMTTTTQPGTSEPNTTAADTATAGQSNEVLDQFKSVLLDEVRAVVGMAVRGLGSEKLRELGLSAIVKLFDKAANMILDVERRRLVVQADNRALEWQVLQVRAAARRHMDLAKYRELALCETTAKLARIEQERVFKIESLRSYYDARVDGLVELLQVQRERYVKANAALFAMKALRHGVEVRVQTVEQMAQQCRDGVALVRQTLEEGESKKGC